MLWIRNYLFRIRIRILPMVPIYVSIFGKKKIILKHLVRKLDCICNILSGSETNNSGSGFTTQHWSITLFSDHYLSIIREDRRSWSGRRLSCPGGRRSWRTPPTTPGSTTGRPSPPSCPASPASTRWAPCNSPVYTRYPRASKERAKDPSFAPLFLS